MDERASYSEIRSWFLNCYYEYCRSKLFHKQQWEAGEYEFGYAYDEFQNAFISPIEKLMLEVLTVILAGGRLPESEQYHWQKIASLLAENDLQKMLIDLPQDEADSFRHDLKLLKLIA